MYRNFSILLESGNILLEADSGPAEREMFRHIEDEIKRIFNITDDIKVRIPLGNRAIESPYDEVTLDDARRITGDNTLGTAPVRPGRQQADDDADDGEQGGEIPLPVYIRVYVTGLLIYPEDAGGMGIGNSQTARNRLNRIFACSQKPRPKDPDHPEGTWLLPKPHPGKMDDITIAQLRDPEKLPQLLKDYIALMSKAYLPGMFRICFNEFGMKSYVVHNNRIIRDALGDTADVPPRWDYNRMYTLAHKIIPQLVLRTKIAPMGKTDNCDRSTLAQNADYLGKENLEMVQDMVDPVEKPIDSNLRLGGKEELSFNQLLRITDQWNYTLSEIEQNASVDKEGRRNFYTPPDDDADIGSAKVLDGLAVSTKTDDDDEYPSSRIGDWYIGEIDKSRVTEDAATDSDGPKTGFISFPESPTGKFYFRGGPRNDDVEWYGVYQWCIAYGMMNNYRNFQKGDRAYFLIHKDALQDWVLRTHGDRYSTGGNAYDSTAFGIIIAGPGWADSEENIPGLVKRACLEGRNDYTPIDSAQPGDKSEYTYDKRIIPGGGTNIPGIIRLDSRWESKKQDAAHCINNSIFSLFLIGKWDGSIQVVDDEGNFVTDELIELMQRWFPVDIGETATTTKSLPMLKVKDINAASEIIDSLTSKPSERDKNRTIVEINGIPYHLSKELSKFDATVMLNANDEAKLRAKRERGELDEDGFMNELKDIRALGFAYVGMPARLYPISTEPMTVKEVQAKLKEISDKKNEMWSTPEDHTETVGDIRYLPAAASRMKTHRVGVTKDRKLVIKDMSSDSEPVELGNSEYVLPEAYYTMTTAATYMETPNGDINVWVTKSMLSRDIIYVRNGKMRKYEIIGNTFPGTTNTILSRYTLDGERYAIGDLKGDLARLNKMNADRYTGFVDCTRPSRFIDGIGLDDDKRGTLRLEHMGEVGLTVPNTDMAGGTVGTIDWYRGDNLEFTGSTPVTLDMLAKNPGKLPAITKY